MTTTLLEQAISLIEQGNMPEAQRILEEILTAEPQNLTAWSWYVKTYPPGEKQIKALRLCLQYNPENEQVKQVLSRLQDQIPAKRSIGIGWLYLGTISTFLLEIAIIFYLEYLRMGMLSLVLMMPVAILAAIQVLIIGAVGPVYMLFKMLIKSLSQPRHEKQPAKITAKHNNKVQWAVIFSMIVTGFLTSSLSIFFLINGKSENPFLLGNGSIDIFTLYIPIFWFIVGTNFSTFIIKIFDWVTGAIKAIRGKSEAA